MRQFAVVLLATILGLTAPAPRTALGAWDEVLAGDPDRGTVALTFDAGSVDGPASVILDTLRTHEVRLTFFLTGQWVETYPDLARQVAEDGHELANHSYYHSDLTRLNRSQIIWELDYTDGIVQANLGRGTRPWFRPPFGARDQRVLDIARELGFRSVYWTLDSGDWRRGATAAAVQAKVLNNVSAGGIVVHHLASEATAEALPAILETLQARGLRVVTVSELLGVAGTEEPVGD